MWLLRLALAPLSGLSTCTFTMIERSRLAGRERIDSQQNIQSALLKRVWEVEKRSPHGVVSGHDLWEPMGLDYEQYVAAAKGLVRGGFLESDTPDFANLRLTDIGRRRLAREYGEETPALPS